MNLFVRLRWHDPRLAHEGTGNIKRDLAEVWDPRALLLNLQRSWATLPDVVDISPEGEVVLRFRVWGDFSQPLDLRAFPFDRHVFEIPIIPSGYSTEEVVMIADPEMESYIMEKLSVADWEIRNGWGESRPLIVPSGTLSSFVFTFEAKRRPQHYLIKGVLPLMLIVGMSWVVFWIDPKEAGSQLGVSVTSVLTLIAFHISLTGSLPEIHYLTRMDLFIIGSTFLVFASLVEVVATSRLASSDRLERARRIDLVCRILFPAAFAALTVYSLLLR